VRKGLRVPSGGPLNESDEHTGTRAIRGRGDPLAAMASQLPVAPLAKLSVGPEDFPFLSQLRGHDGATFARARANPGGFPWLEKDAIEA
jgi:hypothetical protein